MKRIVNNNNHSVTVGIGTGMVSVQPFESILVEDSTPVSNVPAGVYIQPQNVMMDSRTNARNVLMG